jgi:hypothetical protein
MVDPFDLYLFVFSTGATGQKGVYSECNATFGEEKHFIRQVFSGNLFEPEFI